MVISTIRKEWKGRTYWARKCRPLFFLSGQYWTYQRRTETTGTHTKERRRSCTPVKREGFRMSPVLQDLLLYFCGVGGSLGPHSARPKLAPQCVPPLLAVAPASVPPPSLFTIGTSARRQVVHAERAGSTMHGRKIRERLRCMSAGSCRAAGQSGGVCLPDPWREDPAAGVCLGRILYRIGNGRGGSGNALQADKERQRLAVCVCWASGILWRVHCRFRCSGSCRPCRLGHASGNALDDSG